MAGAIVVMALFDELGLTFWYAASYLGFAGLTIVMNMLSIPPKPRRRLLLLFGLGGIGFVVLIARSALQLI